MGAIWGHNVSGRPDLVPQDTLTPELLPSAPLHASSVRPPAPTVPSAAAQWAQHAYQEMAYADAARTLAARAAGVARQAAENAGIERALSEAYIRSADVEAASHLDNVGAGVVSSSMAVGVAVASATASLPRVSFSLEEVQARGHKIEKQHTLPKYLGGFL
eukprot:TRINITY_DN21566_c0_g1_i1.p2 TRINITY_DN21566_c0_g1~~TRINITY_DN21566_c0_g1_i1.p2  ORF type:complete len:178 (+),score=28.60 TRINITY_DN21566_c0_g1_i1:53-535(+)